MTLVEMLVAMAILVVVFAAVMPQIRAIRNSWASKRENVEVIQNGRVLMDHITFNLTQANKITAVSDSGETNGYIEFEDSDSNTMRYEISASSYVEFGPVGSLSELAGPVSQLQFTCYDVCDLDTAITDVNQIRTVKVQSILTNSAALGRDLTLTAQAYLRTNASGGGGQTVSEEPSSEFEFDTTAGSDHALCQIDATNYLCAYQGPGNDGWAVILTVNTSNWTITKGTSFEFETSKCDRPTLSRIDATNYLCAYCGPGDDGWAVILTIDTGTGTITMGTPFEFDTSHCEWPALSQVDSDDYLCAYRGPGAGPNKWGWAVILTVDTGTGTITKGTPFVFDNGGIQDCTLANIDNVHHLCAYSTSGWIGTAVVLTADTSTRTITKESSFVFEPLGTREPDLCKIDQEHFLCAYKGEGTDGYAIVLTVNTGTWVIGKGTPHEFDLDQCHDPALAQINENDFLCAYGDFGVDGVAVVLRVDTQTDSVTSGSAYMYDEDRGNDAALAKVDDSHFLCAYDGLSGDGYAVILTVGSMILP